MVDLIEKVTDAVLIVDDAGYTLARNNCTLGEYEEWIKPFKTVITLDDFKEWLSSFDSNSATECFTAVNLLKQRLEGEDDAR